MSKPLVPWIGGKRKLAKHLLPLFPSHQCYVEPFAGAAALFFMKPRSKVEVLNDINGDIINLYRVVNHHPDELFKQFEWGLCSRQQWQQLKATPAHVLTDVQRAARFLYLQKLAFGGKVAGQTFGTATSSRPKLNTATLKEDLHSAHQRLQHTLIEHLDWQACIKKYDRPHTLFYCDPPYWQTEGYGVDFPLSEYQALAELAKSGQGKMIISLNDHPDIRDIMQGLTCTQVPYGYTVGGGQRRTHVHELIIRNF